MTGPNRGIYGLPPGPATPRSLSRLHVADDYWQIHGDDSTTLGSYSNEFVVPVLVPPKARRLTGLAMRCTTAGVGTGTYFGLVFGIYAPGPDDDMPDRLIGETALLSMTSTGYKTIDLNVPVDNLTLVWIVNSEANDAGYTTMFFYATTNAAGNTARGTPSVPWVSWASGAQSPAGYVSNAGKFRPTPTGGFRARRDPAWAPGMYPYTPYLGARFSR